MMNENPIAIIFIGRSGSGKGTQAQLIKQYFDTKGLPNLYLGTGNAFRDMMTKDDFTARKAKQIYEEGGRHPDFLAITLLGNIFRFEYQEHQNLLIDGAARSLTEAMHIMDILTFYNIKNIKIIHLNVSHEWSVDKLTKRARSDDNDRIFAVKKEWYDHDVVPAIGFFKNNPAVDFCDINGEQGIDQIHQDIITCLE